LQMIASPSADAVPMAGSLVVLTVALEIDGLNWLAAGPLVIEKI